MIQGPIEILNADTTVRSLVGQNKAADKYKNYWVFAPETEEVPYQILFMTGNDPSNHKQHPSDVDHVRFSLRTYHTVAERTDALASASRAALEGKNVTAGGYLFQRIWLVDQRDGYDNAAKLPFRESIYSSHVERTVPT